MLPKVLYILEQVKKGVQPLQLFGLNIPRTDPRSINHHPTTPPRLTLTPKAGKIILLGGRKIYAIIETGGKQYKVTQGQTIDVELLDVAEGKSVELDKVLFIADGEQVTTGKPLVDGAKVVATSQGNGRNKKIVVFKYKPKVRYRSKTGHRQHYTRLAIDQIVMPGAEEKPPVKRVRRTKKEVEANGT